MKEWSVGDQLQLGEFVLFMAMKTSSVAAAVYIASWKIYLCKQEPGL